MLFTVFGATGFIGSRLVQTLMAAGHECYIPARNELPVGRNLGYVFYCIGLTADFRERLADTVEAHVCHLHKVLTSCDFERFCYLSSTRVYAGLDKSDEEQRLCVDVLNPSDVYNISKIMGESACLHLSAKTVVARISNVFSPNHRCNSFLDSIIQEAKQDKLELRTDLNSEKDYVLLTDVVDILIKVLVYGKHRIYNVAQGKNTTHRQIVNALGCRYTVQPGAPKTSFPAISVERAKQEFGYTPQGVLNELVNILAP